MPELDRSMYGKTPLPRWKVGDIVTPKQGPEGVLEWTVTRVDGAYVFLSGDGMTTRRHARDVLRVARTTPSAPARGADVTLALFDETTSTPRRPLDDVDGMSVPVRCKWCHAVHDAGTVTVVQRYHDRSVWHCPNCNVLIDDRPESWGGSAIPVDASRS